MLVTNRRSLQGIGQRPALKSLRTPQANEQTDPALSHDNLPIFVPLKQARYQQPDAIEAGAHYVPVGLTAGRWPGAVALSRGQGLRSAGKRSVDHF